jgi:ribosomal protein S27AE
MYQRSNPTSDKFTASPSKYPQGSFKDKPCRTCGETFSPIAPSHLHCSDACSTLAQTNRYLTRTYGITLSDYEAMLEAQNRLCKLCGGEGFCMANHHKLRLVVDHCHRSGAVRGLLCHNCNRALGLLKDNTQTLLNAIAYLEGATTIPEGSTAKRLEAQDTAR